MSVSKGVQPEWGDEAGRTVDSSEQSQGWGQGGEEVLACEPVTENLKLPTDLRWPMLRDTGSIFQG